MKIAIVSDIHDNKINLDKFLAYCQTRKVDKIICCGDVTSSDTINYFATKFFGEIILARGNIDMWYDEELEGFSHINYLGREGGVVIVDKIRVGVCHEPRWFIELDKEKPQIVFYGHTHRPWQEKKKGVLYINPGTLGGMFMEGTFAIYDTKVKSLELKRINQYE